MGFRPYAAVEYEYFLFEETPHSIREKGYRGLRPMSPGMFGYSVLRASAHAEVVHRIVDQMRDYGVEIEGIHTETGPGVYETAIAYDEALRAADHAALFKTGVKEIAARSGLVATFMAKWSPDLPGCSGHAHMSLWDGERNLFSDGKGGLSETARHFIGGQLALMSEWMALVCPTVNSYKRTVPGTWAPTGAAWGVENRTTALRAIPGRSPKSTRVEYRLAGADANPYLVLAAGIASGLYGVEGRLDPPTALSGDAYSAPPERVKPLPCTLEEAAAGFRRSAAARADLGEEFVDHFAMTREWEVRQFRKAVTDWELQRYFEII
jgi:glutamine synthetase